MDSSFLDGWLTSPRFKVLAGLFALPPSGMGAWVWDQGRREGVSALATAGVLSVVVIISSLPGAALNPYFWLAFGIIGAVVTA